MIGSSQSRSLVVQSGEKQKRREGEDLVCVVRKHHYALVIVPVGRCEVVVSSVHQQAYEMYELN